MDRLILNLDNKTTLIVNPNTLLIFLDETGEETFRDKNAPFFGFGGIVIPCRDYFKQIECPWHKLKTQFFNGPNKPLHACDLKLSPDNPEELKIIEALNSFFYSSNFGRIAITSSDKTVVDIKESIASILSALIWDRVKEVQEKMSWFNISDILVLIEENPRLIPALKQEFMSKTLYNKNNQKINVKYCTILKDPCFAGLEVADFVAHTAGRQARIMRNHLFDKKISISKPDFTQMFEGKNEKKSSYFSISRISVENKS